MHFVGVDRSWRRALECFCRVLPYCAELSHWVLRNTADVERVERFGRSLP
jgi:hypothetical protein